MSIHKRGDRWQARIDLGINPATGKRWQVSKSFRIKTAAERWEREQQDARERGPVQTYDMRPLAVYLEKWVTEKPKLRASSRLLYRRRIANYINPTLGHMPVCEVKARHIQELIYGVLAPRGLAGWTLRKTLSILRTALGDAERLDLVPRNEATRVATPPDDAPPAKHWTAPQVRTYLNVARRDAYWPLWLIAAHTGMRRGELCGLRWGDLDSANGVIRIVQQVTIAPGVGREIGPPKTKSSARPVALSASCIAALRLHKAAQNERRLLLADLWEDKDLIFPNALGREMHPYVVTEHHANLCKAAGLAHIKLHDIRHTASSLLHELGIPLRVVGDRLGHANLDMTAHYTHADLQAQRAAAGALETLLEGPQTEEVRG